MKIFVFLLIVCTFVYSQSINSTVTKNITIDSPPKRHFICDPRFKYPLLIGLGSTVILGSVGYGFGLIHGRNDMPGYRPLHGLAGSLIGGSIGLVVGLPIGIVVGIKKHRGEIAD
ncbi:MAG: hypothetical protein JW915_00635 [Chitinispirillaceae bacterium]|nr:hypothetical protein [Chitinispirillaceae bacterium]